MPLPTSDLRIVRELRLNGVKLTRVVEDVLADAGADQRRLSREEYETLDQTLRDLRGVLHNLQKVSDPLVRKAERVIEEYHQLREELEEEYTSGRHKPA